VTLKEKYERLRPEVKMIPIEGFYQLLHSHPHLAEDVLIVHLIRHIIERDRSLNQPDTESFELSIALGWPSTHAGLMTDEGRPFIESVSLTDMDIFEVLFELALKQREIKLRP
jgi:hypothetical protein